MPPSATDTLERAQPASLLLDAVPEAEEQWELLVTLPYEDGTVFAKAVLSGLRQNTFFSVRTKLVIIHDGPASPGLTTDVDGELSPSQAIFDVHIIDPEIELPPLNCLLFASDPGQAYDGQWSAPCADPQACGCDGMNEKIRLEKCETGTPSPQP